MLSDRVIIVRGNFAEGNFGDDALLLAVRGLLSRHYCDSRILFDCPKLANRHNHLRNARVVAPGDVMRAAAILYGGGTQFFSFPGASNHEGKSLRRLLRTLRHPKRLVSGFRGRRRLRFEATLPKVGVGLGCGPFVAGSTEERATQTLLKQMRFLWVRDAVSVAFCQKTGIRAVTQAPDLCFLPSFQAQYIPHRMSTRMPVSPQVGIVLRDWRYGTGDLMSAKEYLKCGAICRQNGMRVRFFVFSPDRDTSTMRQLNEAGEMPVCWTAESMQVEEYVLLLDSCDVLVTSRFHGAVFALLLGKPFVAIEIEPKLKGASELYRGQDILVEPRIAPSDLFHRIQHIFEHLGEYNAQAIRVRDELTERATDAQAEFDTSITTIVEL